MNQPREKGLALILVMTVVLALAIIATPFVLSMILQERTGTTARYLSQADYGADGAKNYALWRLMLSVDALERKTSGATSSYYFDTESEFDIRLDDDIRSRIQISNPTGSIWGVAVQDEQGKLNARTCNVNALGNLASMVDGRVINLKDYITLYSGRDATWVCPQRIRPAGFQTGAGSGGVAVDLWSVLGKGSRVRVSKPGRRPMETRISNNRDSGLGGPDYFTTEQSIAAYMDGVIEVEARHPVNINTARRETLIAMFEGLHLFGIPSSLVTRQVATQLATRFVGRDIQRMEQFLEALDSASLNRDQRKAVILNAVCPSAAVLNGSGTVPVGFKSYDVYTLEAFASMNNPAGTEVAGRGYREVVSVSPPAQLRRSCESQYDFNQMMFQLLTAMKDVDQRFAFGDPRSMAGGFPYGNRLLSYPRPYTERADIALKNAQKGTNEAFITLHPAQDHRGWNPENFDADLEGWADPHSRDHFRSELDGKKMSGTESYPWRKFFALNHLTEDEDPNDPSGERPDTGSGGFELWARFDSNPGGVTIFEIQEQPTTNRVSLRVEGTDLVLTAADSTIPNTVDPDGRIANGVAEIRWPMFQITPDTWTHFAAYWKSNRHADLALLVDGFSDPQAKFMHYDQPGGGKLMTKLSSAMTQTSTNLAIQDNSILPVANELTPLLIGDEVVLFDKGSGTCVRGARGTAAIDHPSQVNVSLYGYSSKIRRGSVRVYPDRGIAPMLTVDLRFDGGIPQTNATLRADCGFGINPVATVAGDKPQPVGMMTQIDNSQNQIGVVAPASFMTDFPKEGYIKINNEIIYYTDRSLGTVSGSMPPATARFTGCLRAQHGTVASVHVSGSRVELWSICVSDFNNFPQPDAIIQIDDEWFGPVRKDPSGKNFWIGYVDATSQTPIPFPRGTRTTIPGNHSGGTKVLPTFMCKDVNYWPSYGWAAGAGDRITLVDAANQKETARIRWATGIEYDTQNPTTANWQPPTRGRWQIAALYDHARRPWVPDDLHVRMLKFPSGELLSRAFLNTASPQVTIGPIQGQIDEMKGFASSKGRVRLWQVTGSGDTTVYINRNIRLAQDGGILKMGDEYMGYGKWTDDAPTRAILTQCKRGWLNSTAETHDRGGNAFYLPWIPVAALAADVGPEDKIIRMRQALAGDPQNYRKGYVLLDNEMVLFEWAAEQGRTLTMPARWDGQGGLYRGMFGTQPASHSSGTSLVYGLPYRAFDTYKAREFDNTMVYYQWSTKMDLAHWYSFRWTQDIPAQDKNILIHAIARVDGKGEFWDPPGMNDNVMVLDSVTPGTNVKIDRAGYQHDAGQFDVRFYIEYKQGSFDAMQPRQAESWKRYPKIKEIHVEYDRPSQTLHHEDR